MFDKQILTKGSAGAQRNYSVVVILMLVVQLVSCGRESGSGTHENAAPKTDQTKSWQKVHLDSVSGFEHPDYEEVQQAYTFHDLTLGTAKRKNRRHADDYWPIFFVIDKEHHVLFESKQGADVNELHFFAKEGEEELFVFMDQSFEYAFGCEVFHILNKQVRYSGHLDIAKEYFYGYGVGLFGSAALSEENDQLILQFKTDSISLFDTNERYDSNEIRYRYSEEKGEFELEISNGTSVGDSLIKSK